ncbi:SDR family oxidoreductase [Natronorubrum thiooxidans]|uniref:NAD(P)-dependent dehydrogenase, short-chain alcohol dehydrogenase family n=1 Tax=Natronorubrum thiooxidans TaxID=308853 RepID=A0A1N7GP94_9EURY|nr:SDR family oxidoreductase [Natronorubrum thiooxidans]SIS14381.1 NAD(P)-dependent dehydrogenase, short-chain alcohol dehydrogenase family [Natronorubrum thiooxidans]
MNTVLDGETAVITGAASGIGRAIALTFADAGADVVVADLREEPRQGGVPTHERITDETDAEATYVECDVTDQIALEAAIDAADEFGGLSIMVNNAGVFGPMGSITEISVEDYRDLMAINLDSVFVGSKLAAEKLIEQGEGGAIVNISSLAGLQGYGEIAPYCTAKAGIRNLTYSLADDLGPHGIRVNAIHPGEVETALTTEDFPIVGTEQEAALKQMIPLQKLAQPEDVANAALFLASDMAGHITAESLLVDGGTRNTS